MPSTTRLSKRTLMMLSLSLNLLGNIVPSTALPQSNPLPSTSQASPAVIQPEKTPYWNESTSSSSLIIDDNDNENNNTTPLTSNKRRPNCKMFCNRKSLHPTYNTGPSNPSFVNTTILTSCIDDLWTHLNPSTHTKHSSSNSNSSSSSSADPHPYLPTTDWRPQGYHCGPTHIIQLGQTKGHATPSQILQNCHHWAQEAAKAGREWFNCQLQSPNGVSTRAWFGWSFGVVGWMRVRRVGSRSAKNSFGRRIWGIGRVGVLRSLV
ncbi:hypothetical protein BST61_g1209 [Cercospora zeina]